jgi:hypothetical protein
MINITFLHNPTQYDRRGIQLKTSYLPHDRQIDPTPQLLQIPSVRRDDDLSYLFGSDLPRRRLLVYGSAAG